MARIEQRREVSTSLSPVEARAHVLAAFAARKATMAATGIDYLEGRTGSQVSIRLKGGLWAKPEDFPVVAAVKISPSGAGAVVRLTVADDLGFGGKTGMQKKYLRAVETFAAQLVNSLTAAGAHGRTCPAGHEVDHDGRFCGACGAVISA